MVQGLIPFFCVIVLQKGETGHPDKAEFIFVDEPQFFTQEISEVAEGFVGNLWLVGDKKQEIAISRYNRGSMTACNLSGYLDIGAYLEAQ